MVIHVPICHADNYVREKTVNVLEQLFWTVQPPIGLIKGDSPITSTYSRI